MEAITSEVFLALINSESEVVNKTISGNSFIEKSIFENSLIIEDCVFDDKVLIKGVDFNNTISFRKCLFKQGISLVNSSFNYELIFDESNIFESLIFSNISLQSLQFIGGECEGLKFTGSIKSSENSQGQISFNGGAYKQLDFSSSELNCSVELKSGRYETINFEKSKLTQSVVINDGIELNNFYISNSEFFDRVVLSNATIKEMFYTNIATFNGPVIIDKYFKAKSFYLNYVLAKQSFSIKYDGNIKSLDIHSSEFLSSFNCYYSTMLETKEDTSGLSFTIGGVIKGNIIFENITLPSISISGVNFGNLIFKKIETHLITITDFYNQNKLTFADLKLVYKNHALIIFDSNINSTEFVNVDFRKFNELVIVKSEVSNLMLSNSVFPTKVQIGTKNPVLGYVVKPDEKISDNIYYKETYRQLKQASEKQGNRASSLVFRAKEMHYLRKEMRWGWDKVLLYLNYISNNHGLSWSRGLVFTVGVSWILFAAYEASLTHPVFSWTTNVSSIDIICGFNRGLEAFSTFWASFPLFKNLETEHITWKTNLVFILSRIFIGYGIYQAIMAFRKFVLK